MFQESRGPASFFPEKFFDVPKHSIPHTPCIVTDLMQNGQKTVRSFFEKFPVFGVIDDAPAVDTLYQLRLEFFAVQLSGISDFAVRSRKIGRRVIGKFLVV